ncbi:M48 family metalloprotease [Methanosarcina sp. KYL-1]|uniref:M48 family metalloprotease n=1 Tax=Methanosarcina sp. KYL-1 TaxID=2602068 RepID=UPI00210113BC|nr:M48 family metalloprotease [Methanosarcina sp. KYL-1]MCQ1535501.1 M48 family metalloprotease [Methanosarcina sp. KYL-1]
MAILSVYIYLSSGRWVLKWYKAQKVPRNERSLLYTILETLASRAQVRAPDLYSFESEIPVMFTVKNGSNASIAISTAMLKTFDDLNLEVFLAHEIGHIKNRDVSLNTVTALFAGLIMTFPELVMWGSILSGFGQPEDPAPRVFRFIATALAAPPAATLVQLTRPVRREFEADAEGIKITRNPKVLAKNLEFLEQYIPLQPVISKFNPGHFHLFGTHTHLSRGDSYIFISLFDTHPEIGARTAHILSHSSYPENGIIKKYSRVPGYFDLRSWKLAMASSFVSYMVFLFVIIVVVTFALKDFNFLINGGIAAGYTGAVLMLMGITAKVTIGKYHKKSLCRFTKQFFRTHVRLLRYFVKKERTR